MKNKFRKFFCLSVFLSLLLATNHCFFSLKKENKTLEVSQNNTLSKIAYLTFDDGPSNNTEKILEILDKYNIKATFFVVGPEYKLKNDLLIKIVKSGHQLAIHSYEHNYNYIYSSKENYLKDFYKCYKWIKKITGVSTNIFRFPGGSSNTIATKQIIKSIIAELEQDGFTHADWNVDTLDSYAKNETNKIISNAMTSLKRNENNNHYYQTILMHDDINKPASIKALPTLIEKFIANGYNFKVLNENSHIIKHVK